MSLRSLPPLLRNEPAMTRVVGSGTSTLAVAAPAQAFVVAGLASLESRSPTLVVTPTSADAERIAHDLAAFLGPERVVLFPAWETLPFERVSPEVATMGRRLEVLWRLRGAGGSAALDDTGDAGGTGTGTAGEGAAVGPDPTVIVAPVKALLQQLGPWQEASEPVVVTAGGLCDPDGLVRRLAAAGYRREAQVEHRGELALRGGIVDVFPSTAETPVRIDLFGDEVERLTAFDVGDQRSVADLGRVEVFGCREVVPTDAIRERAGRLVAEEPWGRAQWERLSEGQLFDGMESWLPWLMADRGEVPREGSLLTDLLPEAARVVLVEPRRVRDRAAELNDEERALAGTLAVTWGTEVDERFPQLHLPYDRLLARCRAAVLSIVPTPEGPDTPAVACTGWEPLLGDAAKLARQVGDLVDDGFSVCLAAQGRGSAARLAQVLADEGMTVPVVGTGGSAGGPVAATGAGDGAPAGPPPDLSAPGARVVMAAVDTGFVLPVAKVALLAELDMTGRHRPRRRARARARAVDGFFDDLEPGSYVVHRQHGVARYGGMVTRTVAGASRDYLLLEYRGGDKLYLPTDQIDAITPYSGGDDPSVHRLGGSEWQRTRAKARAAVHEVAEELVTLYRKRLVAEGHAFAPDTPWQHELEEGFPYTETLDQRRAIEDVKTDMEQARPMDRLVCGDVGFGKTEVAVRAVFKAVQDGRQAAVLVPTTLLASQHHQTFSERFAPFPIRVELLSRFLTPSQAKAVVDGLADGSVDVVIGTHRLLAGDLRFRNLGLLVVDEEQRFGVSHKEAIKALAEGVDVLTLTASPIPRTLEMTLTGIRDLSMVNTPPADRQPILTYVGEYDEAAVSEAIRRELLREGQVFFVHNRVADIGAVADRLRRLVPEARTAVAHGQMDEGTLEQVVLDFWHGEYDVLVCTTIIESGIDMPTVNTLVVDRADLLGLGQLHQLRGRVGRAGQRAYAYLFHPADRVLSEQAYERLRTIGEHTELGSGFKIAMRDLQIRGAGNLLGRDQSGHIAAVGYDLYVQMVSEEIAQLKGEARPAPIEVNLDLPGEAHLPSGYIAAEDVRLEAYRRLARARTQAEVDDVGSEWADRFGPPPPPAAGLLEVARLRCECLRLGVTDVAVTVPRPGSAGGMGSGPGGARRPVAKIWPVLLPASAQVRLRRLAPQGAYREELHQLLVPLPAGRPAASALLELLDALVPADSAAGDRPGMGSAGASG